MNVHAYLDLPEYVPPDLNLTYPVINHTSQADNIPDLADEVVRKVEDLMIENANRLSREVLFYKTKNGWYPWEEGHYKRPMVCIDDIVQPMPDDMLYPEPRLVEPPKAKTDQKISIYEGGLIHYLENLYQRVYALVDFFRDLSKPGAAEEMLAIASAAQKASSKARGKSQPKKLYRWHRLDEILFGQDLEENPAQDAEKVEGALPKSKPFGDTAPNPVPINKNADGVVTYWGKAPVVSYDYDPNLKLPEGALEPDKSSYNSPEQIKALERYRWNVYAKFLRQAVESANNLQRPEESSIAAERWKKLTGKINAKLKSNPPLKDILETVNVAINKYEYKEESIDIWKSPHAFLSSDEKGTERGGDCEDYAIMKYTQLLQRGIPKENMRIIVVRSTIGLGAHALLVVDDPASGKQYFLDNLHVFSEYPIQCEPLYYVTEDKIYGF